MGDATKTRMGVCTVEFDSTDLGYTKGFVKVNYKAETVEKEVDQEDVPIDEIVSKQDIEVVVPMAEYDLTKLSTLLPGATLNIDTTKEKITLSGAAGTSLLSLAKQLVIKPVGGTANDWLTLKYAAPKPEIAFSYEKNNLRVYEVTFKALKGINGWVVWGDETASKPVKIESITPTGGTTAGGTAVEISGYGFTGATAVEIDSTTCTGITVVSDKKIIAVTPAKSAGAKDVYVSSPAGNDTLTGGYTYA